MPEFTVSINQMRNNMGNVQGVTAAVPAGAPAPAPAPAPVPPLPAIAGAAGNDNAIRNTYPVNQANSLNFITSVLKELYRGTVFEEPCPGTATQRLIFHIFDHHIVDHDAHATNGGSWRSNIVPKNFANQGAWFRSFITRLFHYIIEDDNYIGDQHGWGESPITINNPASGIAITLPFDNADLNNVKALLVGAPAPAIAWLNDLDSRTIGGAVHVMNIDKLIINIQKWTPIAAANPYKVWSISPRFA